MKKKFIILMIVLVLIYPLYKATREMVWVRNCSYTIDNTLKIRLRVDTDIFGFQDFNNDKTITVTNVSTKATMKASYVSLEPDIYFYIDTTNSSKMLSIVDKFAGRNIYDFETLKLIGAENCFMEFGGCGGFNDSSFAKLGAPSLSYENGDFYR